MSESILNALIHLFAIVANIRAKKLTQAEKEIVQEFLEKYLNRELLEEYLRVFDNYFDFYQRELREDSNITVASYSLISFQITNVCRQIKKELLRDERMVVFIQLLEFIHSDSGISEGELKFIKTVATTFNISDSEYNNCKALILDGRPDNIEQDKVLVIDNQLREWSESLYWMMKKKTRDIHSYPYKHIYKENLYGQLLFLYLKSINSFVFKYSGQLSLYIEGQKIEPEHPYFFKSGSIIKGPNITPIYFHDVSSKFLEDSKTHIILNTYNVSFTFKNSENGIKSFNISEEAGQLIGIMGGSGVGKSTLLNVLNGNIPPDEGKIMINGYDIHTNHEEIKGLIGHVPQDDLLIEELTVYQNLYYNARLCFRDFNEKEIHNKVTETLDVLDLMGIKNLKVGSPLNKYISGGQRKRLNIGLELMREPYIMFIDEPTTGLSSMDSENVMYLLKNQALKGKLIIVNIHQPSSEVYKLFDTVWVLDKGGYPIYQGNPIDAVVYFKTVASQVNAAESECPHCGNVNPEQILKIVEARKVDDFGKPVKERKTSPETWSQRYKEQIESKLSRKKIHGNLPKINFSIPSPLKQFSIFSVRNLISKLSNRQYILLNLVEAPMLALILSYFSKFITSEGYIFAQNKNFPVFLFMSIIVALFMGLTVSAEEIIKDRKILERETFLNLSWTSYLNSKIVYLFGLSAIQTLTFVIISNEVLEIQSMLIPFWIVLFSTSFFGNMIGLNISGGLNSVITIYILIPLILVPHLLLGGAMIPFNDLHKNITSQKYVPLIGNFMVTRWAYEAMTVKQFKANSFEKKFFEYDKAISNADYKTSFLIPELEAKLEMAWRNLSNEENIHQVSRNLMIIKNELIKLQEDAQKPPFEYFSRLTPDKLNSEVFESLKDYLVYLNLYYVNLGKEFSGKRSNQYNKLIEAHGLEWVRKLKQENHNQRLASIVQNTNEVKKMYETSDEIIQKKDPVFMDPLSDVGKAHFYAPYKNLKGLHINTFAFNLIIIWIGVAVLYYALIFNVLKKLLHQLDIFLSGLTSFNQK
ncbi:MAG: ATP-binding cassette domain-containing protein [Bacteroidales bacterium]